MSVYNSFFSILTPRGTVKRIKAHASFNVSIQYQAEITCTIWLFVHFYQYRSLRYYWMWTSLWPVHLEYIAVLVKSVGHIKCCKGWCGVHKKWWGSFFFLGGCCVCLIGVLLLLLLWGFVCFFPFFCGGGLLLLVCFLPAHVGIFWVYNLACEEWLKNL